MISRVRRLSVAEIDSELRNLEAKYNMRSDEFHERYIHGKIDHRPRLRALDGLNSHAYSISDSQGRCSGVVYASEIESYLEYIARQFGNLGGTFLEGPAIDLDYDDNFGILELQLQFHNKSRLDVALVSAGPESFPDWLDYSFHFMDADDRFMD